ncbi:hypothetical protein [Nocardia sp. CC227C]|uniref:hypothetical protein n=1 Tax=Nocardia sp. CC227C TaxID=3044562 RepID=UPI00278C2D93|nr:hypothetical protein [Nocardia sp. CC227C]
MSTIDTSPTDGGYSGSWADWIGESLGAPAPPDRRVPRRESGAPARSRRGDDRAGFADAPGGYGDDGFDAAATPDVGPEADRYIRMDDEYDFDDEGGDYDDLPGWDDRLAGLTRQRARLVDDEDDLEPDPDYSGGTDHAAVRSDPQSSAAVGSAAWRRDRTARPHPFPSADPHWMPEPPTAPPAVAHARSGGAARAHRDSAGDDTTVGPVHGADARPDHDTGIPPEHDTADHDAGAGSRFATGAPPDYDTDNRSGGGSPTRFEEDGETRPGYGAGTREGTAAHGYDAGTPSGRDEGTWPGDEGMRAASDAGSRSAYGHTARSAYRPGTRSEVAARSRAEAAAALARLHRTSGGTRRRSVANREPWSLRERMWDSRERWAAPLLGVLAVCAVAAAVLVQVNKSSEPAPAAAPTVVPATSAGSAGSEGSEGSGSEAPESPVASSNDATAPVGAATPECPAEVKGEHVRGNGPGGTRTGPDAILALQHAYYVARSGALARELVAADAAVPSAADIQAGIDTIPPLTTHCVQISPGAFSGQYIVIVTEFRPDASRRIWSPQLVMTTTAADRTLINAVIPLPDDATPR